MSAEEDEAPLKARRAARGDAYCEAERIIFRTGDMLRERARSGSNAGGGGGDGDGCAPSDDAWPTCITGRCPNEARLSAMCDVFCFGARFPRFFPREITNQLPLWGCEGQHRP